MKLLPCQTCDTKHASLDGEGRVPYTLAVFPRDGREFTVKCRRCRTATILNVFEFNARPDLSPADMEALGLLDDLAKDLTLGGALHIDHARDLARAGLGLADVHALEPLQTPQKPQARTKRRKG